MKKNLYRARFEEVLANMKMNRIESRSQLMQDQELYLKFWLAAQDFVNCYALKSKTSTVKDGKGKAFSAGNSAKIDSLECAGVGSRADLQMDCLLKIVEKLDLVLKQPLEAQPNYVYRMCNNVVYDALRRAAKNSEVKLVSLQEQLPGSDSDHADRVRTYEDKIGDCNTPESLLMERENIAELKLVLAEKQEAERKNTREEIRSELSVLGKNTTRAFVSLSCTYLNKKPRELTEELLQKGIAYAYEDMIAKLYAKARFEGEELRGMVPCEGIRAARLKLDSRDPKLVSHQISDVLYEVKKQLKKAG